MSETRDRIRGPIGGIALELHEPDPPVRQRLAANFDTAVAMLRSHVDLLLSHA